jgi:flagellar protein FlaH
MYSVDLENIDRVNEHLGGGLPEGAIVLIEGNYGAGKSALTQRFAYGLCEAGYRVTLISTELRVTRFLTQMHSLGYKKIETHLLNEDLLFLHADLGKFKGKRELLKRMTQSKIIWKPDVIAIDTFDAILRNDATFDSLVRQDQGRDAALSIISYFRDMIGKGKTIILTVDPTNLSEDVINPFRSVADVYFDIEMMEVGSEIRRSINVNRFAGGGEQVGCKIGFSVRAGVGIVVEARSVV